jgi:hypothetical protein
MGKRRAGSQTGSLTPDHKKSGIDLLLTSRFESAIRRWKDLGEGYKFGLDLAVGSYELPKSQDSTRDSFGTISGLQPGSPGKK